MARRKFALAAATVAAVILCYLLLPIQLHEWDFPDSLQLPLAPDSWLIGYRAVYERYGAPLGLSGYYFWGRFFFIVYAGTLAGVLVLPPGHKRSTQVARRIVVFALAAALAGDVVAYWGGTNELTGLSGVGFGLIETPALLCLLVSMLIYGIGLARERTSPRPIAWLLITGAVLALPSLTIFSYVPHGVVLVVAFAVAAAAMLSVSTDPAQRM